MLRGAIGGMSVALGLPIFEAMLDSTGTAMADGSALPCRFVTFMFGNGVRLDRWVPTTTGPDYELTEELAPLAGVRDYCSILSGFQHYIPGGNGHTDGVFGSFSGYPGDYYDPEEPLQSRPGGPSIDQVVGDVIGGDTYLRTLQVGNSKRTPSEGGRSISFNGPNQINMPTLNPQDVYRRLFVGPGESDQLRVRMLDAVVDDAARLRAKLGQSDKERLDAHLDGLADLENRLLSIPPECDAPPEPTADNVDIGGIEPLEEVARAMADLVVAAFRCDLVRVVSVQQSGSVCQSVYSMTGATLNNHAMTHEGSAAMQDLVHEAVLVNMEAFAYLLEGLRDQAEGEGNLLDRCVVLMGSDVAEGLSHSSYDMPFIIAGGAGGNLVTPGVHIRDQSRNASDILLTAMRSIAPEIESVGTGPGYSDTTVTELEA